MAGKSKIKMTGVVMNFGGNASGKKLTIGNIRVESGDPLGLLELSSLPAKKRELVNITVEKRQPEFGDIEKKGN